MLQFCMYSFFGAVLYDIIIMCIFIKANKTLNMCMNSDKARGAIIFTFIILPSSSFHFSTFFVCPHDENKTERSWKSFLLIKFSCTQLIYTSGSEQWLWNSSFPSFFGLALASVPIIIIFTSIAFHFHYCYYFFSHNKKVVMINIELNRLELNKELLP